MRIVSSPKDPWPNALAFLAECYANDDHPTLVCHGGVLYTWVGTHWREIEDGALRNELYLYFADAMYGAGEPFRPTRSKVGDLLDAIRARTHLPREVVPPTWLGEEMIPPASETVACANGLLHVPTRRLFTHSPRFYAHHAVPFDYDPHAPTPHRWLAFLDELWSDDPDSIRALQLAFGYLLSGNTSLQKILLVVGPRRSGKGTIGRVLTGLLGRENVAGPTLASLATNFGLSPLIGKPVALVSDARLGSGHSAVIERLLSISGEDLITVDRKHREPWSGQLPTRFVILTNELPRLSDSSGALASRFVPLVMRRTFYGHEDTGLTDALLRELPGILNWTLDGLDALRERGRLLEPESAREVVRELEDLSSPVGAFVRERCELGDGLEVACDALYVEWERWCHERGNRPGTAQTFGRDLRAFLPTLGTARPRTDDGRRERRYRGIALAEGPSSAPSGTSEETWAELMERAARV